MSTPSGQLSVLCGSDSWHMRYKGCHHSPDTETRQGYLCPGRCYRLGLIWCLSKPDPRTLGGCSAGNFLVIRLRRLWVVSFLADREDRESCFLVSYASFSDMNLNRFHRRNASTAIPWDSCTAPYRLCTIGSSPSGSQHRFSLSVSYLWNLSCQWPLFCKVVTIK